MVSNFVLMTESGTPQEYFKQDLDIKMQIFYIPDIFLSRNYEK